MKSTIIIGLALFMGACVSQKKFEASQQSLKEMEGKYKGEQNNNLALQSELKQLKKDASKLNEELATAQNSLKQEQFKYAGLEQQLENLKNINNNLLDRMSDLSVISKAGAESIRKSLDAINQQNNYIKSLTSSIQRKDSLNLVLVMNLKRSLSNFNDDDVTVEVKKGVVYVSLSDKMLFKSGSAEVSAKAEEVLGKIAKVVNDHNELDILVEGHTDNVPIATTLYADNWDLSVKRATSVVRILQTKYNVSPGRMTAGGRSEFAPKSANTSIEGKSLNRRTEIIILPKLDQFFKLLEAPVAVADTKI